MTPQLNRGRLTLLATGALLILALVVLYMFKGILVPFIAGGLLAFLLQPVVKALERVMPWRARWPTFTRTVSVLAIYAVALGVLAGAMYLIVPPAFRQVNEFIQTLPSLFSEIRNTLEAWGQEYSARIPEEIRQRIQESLSGAGDVVARGIQDALTMSISVVTGTFSLVIALVTVPIFLYYLLKDQEALAAGMYSAFPSSIRPHARNIIAIVVQVIGQYVRAQLLLGVVVGALVFLGLFFLGIEYSVLLGLVAGVTELVPIVGPWIAGITGVLVTLAVAPELVIWVALLYLGVQLLENTLLVPRIQGNALNIHPILIIIIIVLGSQLAGIWGVLLGPPLAATVRDVVRYFYREWNALAPPPAPEPPAEQLAPIEPIEKVPVPADDPPDPID